MYICDKQSTIQSLFSTTRWIYPCRECNLFRNSECKIFVAIFCVYQKRKNQGPQIIIKNAMVIMIAIGKYDEYPENQDEELDELYLNDLDIDMDIQHLSIIFGTDYLNYDVYPEYDNHITVFIS